MPAKKLAASIALCTYNGAKYLSRQLESLAGQTSLPSELVVTDDGSTDATLDLLEAFAATSAFPVRITRNEKKLGYRANFMKAASLTRGDLVFFCDQDDVWDPSKLELMAEQFEASKVLLVYHNATVVDAQERELSTLYSASEQFSALSGRPVRPWVYSLGFTQAFRRELLSHDDLWPSSLDHMTSEVMAHDQWFFFLAASLGRVQFVDKALVRHRQHESNTYGVAGRGSRWQRLASRFSHDPQWDRMAAEAAARRARVLAELSERGVLDAANAKDLISRYDTMAGRHSRRYSVYTAASLSKRLGNFARAMSKGDYRGRPWGLDPRAFPRDLLVGAFSGGRKPGAMSVS